MSQVAAEETLQVLTLQGWNCSVRLHTFMNQMVASEGVLLRYFCLLVSWLIGIVFRSLTLNRLISAMQSGSYPVHRI